MMSSWCTSVIESKEVPIYGDWVWSISDPVSVVAEAVIGVEGMEIECDWCIGDCDCEGFVGFVLRVYLSFFHIIYYNKSKNKNIPFAAELSLLSKPDAIPPFWANRLDRRRPSTTPFYKYIFIFIFIIINNMKKWEINSQNKYNKTFTTTIINITITSIFHFIHIIIIYSNIINRNRIFN